MDIHANIPLRFKKEALLQALEALLPGAEKWDKEAIKQHARDERAYLEEFRKACRAAAKLDYEGAKKIGFEAKVIDKNSSWGGRKPRPSCPSSRAQHIRGLIARVQRSDMERWNLTFSGVHSAIYNALMREQYESEKKDVCE